MKGIPHEDIEVVLSHPAGTVRVPLATWIEQGPGPRRLLRPIEVRHRETDELLPISVVPFRYRNSWAARALVRLGIVADPWPSQLQGGDPPAGLDVADLLREAATPPDDLARWLASHEPIDRWPCDPWDRWLLIALHRHLPRQAFVAEVVRDRLSGSLGEIAQYGALEHPQHLEQEGPVPDLPEWRYYFHGMGCCLTHEDGTSIDVDFDEHGATSIDPYFYSQYLTSLPDPDFVESRLLASDVDEDFWTASIQPLLDARSLVGDHRVRLVSAASEWADAASELLERHGTKGDNMLAWVACLIGDYPLAAGLLGASAPTGVVRAARHQEATRCDVLEYRFRSEAGVNSFACIDALRQLDKRRAVDVIVSELRSRSPDRHFARCVNKLTRWGDKSHVSAVLSLLPDLRGDELPFPHARTRAAHFVMSLYNAESVPEATRIQLMSALEPDARASEGEAAFLSYLLNPDAGLDRLGEGLRSDVPMARQASAAALGLLGTSEAFDELRAAATPEATTVLAMLRGQEPDRGPEPIGELIEWRGGQRRVYAFGEIEAAHVADWTAGTVSSFREEHETLLLRWFAT